MSEIKVICPHCKHIDHKGQPTGSINVQKRTGYCFYCGESILGFAIKQAFRLSKKKDIFQEKQVTKVLKPSFYKDYKWIPLITSVGLLATKAKTYLEERGCPEEYMEKYDFGLGAGELSSRIILPTYEAGRLTYFQARSFVGAEPKYWNPPPVTFGGVGKSDVVGFVDNIKSGEEVAICEGIFSTIATNENLMPCVSVFGHSISDTQLVKIVERKPKKVYIIFDPDVTDYECRKEGAKLLRYGVEVEYFESIGGDTWDVFHRGIGKLVQRRRR